MTPIITPEQLLAESRGIKALIAGPPGIGKTSLLRTLKSGATLFADAEAGDLAVRGLPIDTIRIKTWRDACDLACRVGGPNPSFPATSYYSEAHYQSVGGALPNLDRYDTIFVDSITEVSRLSYRDAEQQPEGFSSSGKKDTRGAYGLHGRQMVHWLQQLQHSMKNIVFIAVLERVTDEFNRLIEWRPQLEGGKTGRELPAIVDEIITYQWITFDGADKPTRSFVTGPNPWGYPAKDRSGKLDQLEPPDLGALIAKILPPRASHGAAVAQPSIIPFTQQATFGGPHNKRKIFANILLAGTTEGHEKAGRFSRALLRAIYEAVNGLDPKDTSPAAAARLAGATLASLNGATFVATLDVEKGGKRKDGDGFYKDRNIIGKVLRLGDKGYLKLDQPPAAPIERSVPPQPPTSGTSTAPGGDGSPAIAVAAIAKPKWAEEE